MEGGGGYPRDAEGGGGSTEPKIITGVSGRSGGEDSGSFQSRSKNPENCVRRGIRFRREDAMISFESSRSRMRLEKKAEGGAVQLQRRKGDYWNSGGSCRLQGGDKKESALEGIQQEGKHWCEAA